MSPRTAVHGGPESAAEAPPADQISLGACAALIRDALDSDPLLPGAVTKRDVTVRFQQKSGKTPGTYLVTRRCVTDITSMAIGHVVSKLESDPDRDGSGLPGRIVEVKVGMLRSATLRTARFFSPEALKRRQAAKDRLAAFCVDTNRPGLAKAMQEEGLLPKS